MSFCLKLTLLFYLFCFTATERSHAQVSDADDRGSRFRVTLFNAWDGPLLYVKTKDSYVPLEAHQMAYTQPFRYTSGKPIVLYSRQASDDPAEEYAPYLTVPVPPTIREPLLVLHWNSVGKKGGGKVVEFSPQVFPYGSYQIVNLSTHKIIGYIGDKDKVFTCAPQSSYISAFSFKNGERTAIVAFLSQNDKPNLVFSTLTIHRERKRVILFLNAETNKLGRLVYRSRSLVDFQPM